MITQIKTKKNENEKEFLQGRGSVRIMIQSYHYSNDDLMGKPWVSPCGAFCGVVQSEQNYEISPSVSEGATIGGGE